MSVHARRASRQRAHARPRGAARLGAWAARIVAVLVAFAVGVALGRALEDDGSSPRDRTYVRTLRPLPLAPAPQTVTVTVTTRAK